MTSYSSQIFHFLRSRLQAAPVFLLFFYYLKLFAECSDRNIPLQQHINNINYGEGSSSILFCDKFFDEVVSPFFRRILEAFPAGMLSQNEEKVYLKQCYKFWEDFSRQSEDEYYKKVSVTRWEEKQNSMVNYRLQFSSQTRKSNNLLKLIRRQYDGRCNLVMQTALNVPNFLLYKQLKEPYFHNCLSNPIFSTVIENAGKRFIFFKETMKKNFADNLENFIDNITSVINQQRDGKAVFKEMRQLIMLMFFYNTGKFGLFHFLSEWVNTHINNEGIVRGIIMTTNRFLLSLNPSSNLAVQDTHYEGLYPRWIDVMEESHIKEKCIFAHILAVDIQLFINMAEIEAEVFAMLINEFVTYFQNFLSAKLSFYNVDESECEEASIMRTDLQTFHNF